MTDIKVDLAPKPPASTELKTSNAAPWSTAVAVGAVALAAVCIYHLAKEPEEKNPPAKPAPRDTQDATREYFSSRALGALETAPGP